MGFGGLIEAICAEESVYEFNQRLGLPLRRYALSRGLYDEWRGGFRLLL
jgi:hypothetical protein